MARGLVVLQGREGLTSVEVGWWEKGGKLRQRPAKKSACERHTPALTSVFSTRLYPRKGEENRYSPQHLPGTGLSTVILISPTLLGKYSFLLISCQGPGQKSPFHSCFPLVPLPCRTRFPFLCVLTALYTVPASWSSLLQSSAQPNRGFSSADGGVKGEESR